MSFPLQKNSCYKHIADCPLDLCNAVKIYSYTIPGDTMEGFGVFLNFRIVDHEVFKEMPVMSPAVLRWFHDTVNQYLSSKEEEPATEEEPERNNKKHYPDKCPKCGAPAYIGLFRVDCSKCKG